MSITRRNFFRYCTLSATALGLSSAKLGLLREALANPAAPSVIWLVGASDLGCSISLLNRISDKAGEPATVADVLVGAINLVFHPALMSAAGETAAAALRQTYNSGNYVLVLEGALQTAFGGHACKVYSYGGKDVTFQEAVQELSARSIATVCVGTCACFGGIPAAGSNPTKAMGVRQFTGRPTINISGCPANPDWIVWAIVQLLTGTPVTLDEDGRPVDLYSRSFAGGTEFPIIHDKCPRNPNNTGTPEAQNFGENFHCLVKLGCRGPFTKSRCNAAWNGIGGHLQGTPHPGHWCIGVNAPCHGCVEKTFPGPHSFYQPYAP
ncbi:MAG: iron hydrogenase [Verrucomicrobia bacterium]|nr:iron hydrogenase [Verrucomicrobiota bacterium]